MERVDRQILSETAMRLDAETVGGVFGLSESGSHDHFFWVRFIAASLKANHEIVGRDTFHGSSRLSVVACWWLGFGGMLRG